MININLLDGRRKEILKRQKQTKKINLISTVLAILSLVLLSTVFLFKTNTTNRLNQKLDQVNALETQIGTYKEVFQSLVNITDKLEAVDEIVSTRALAEKKIELFFEIQNSNIIQINQVGLGGAINPLEFEIGGGADNMAQFVDANNFIVQLDPSYNFNHVLLDTLSRNELGTVNFNYIITLEDE